MHSLFTNWDNPPATPRTPPEANSGLLRLLPAELVALILDHLDVNSLLTCRLVCADIKHMVDETTALQYKIELHASGMEDGPPGPLSRADRLEKLRRHQDAWNDLKFSSDESIPMLRGEVWELYGGVLSQARHKRSLAFYQLPSIIRGIQRDEWTIDDLGFPVRDFTMDPSQDLLIVVESSGAHDTISVHLRELRSGQPHPLASNPAVLQHQPEGSNFSYLIQISRDYLGVLFLTEAADHQLIFWNWKTGSRHLALSSSEMTSFCFLSESHVLLSVVSRDDDDGELDWHLTEPTLVVSDFLRSSDEVVALKDADFVCAFHYPIMGPLMVPLGFMVRSDPTPQWKPNSKLQVPFHVAQGQRLFVATLSIVEVMTQAVRTLLLFVPSRTLLSHIRSMPPGEVNRHIEWNEWGPQGTRMATAPSGHSPVWVCYVFGTKFVSPKRRMGALRTIQIYDFNQVAVQRSGGGEHGRVVTKAQVIKRGIFQEEIITHLPYREWTMDAPATESGSNFTAVMLSEDSIVMVAPNTQQPTQCTYRVLSL